MDQSINRISSEVILDHNQIIQIILSVLFSGCSAIGGVKYAMRYFEKTSDKHDKQIGQIQCDMKKYATIEQCRDSKINCRADKAVSIKDIMDKIDKLSDDVIDQNRRREDAKDDNQRLYSEINARLARLEARIEAMMDRDRNGN